MRILFAFLLLAGCAATPPAQPLPPRIVYQGWTWPPYLKTCSDDVQAAPVPHVTMQSDVAKYIEAERRAFADQTGVADDCRNTLAAAVFANSQPAVK
jgi:hypothetical protein